MTAALKGWGYIPSGSTKAAVRTRRPTASYPMSDGKTYTARDLYLSDRNASKLSRKTFEKRLQAGERDIASIFERRAPMPLVGSAAK